jgi:hypothetical protein
MVPTKSTVCSVADKQIHVGQDLAELMHNLRDETSRFHSKVEQLAAASEKSNEVLFTRLSTMTEKFSGQMQQIKVICSIIHSLISESSNNATQNSTSLKTSSDDRAYNIVVFGVAEGKNRTVWSSKVQEYVAGRSVDIADAFRIGKFSANQSRPRPIIVKLRSVWHRRLVLSNACKLAEKPEF